MANSLRNSLLQIAIYSDHIQAAEKILMGNLQVATCENREGQTLLLAAARKGLYNAVLFLLNLEGTHQHHRDMHAYNVVHHASLSQSPNMVRVALSINPIMIQDVSSAATGGCTPAHLALTPAKPNPRVAQLLINSPHFQTNAQDMRGRTVLHLIAHGGHLLILKMLLLRADLNVNQLDIEHHTAFYLACQAGHHHILSVLMQDPRLSLATGEQNERFSKIEKDDLSSVYGLASQPLLRLSCGLNIFHLAAFSGAFKITDWLVKHFPEQVNEKTPKLFCGRSAVHFAILKGHTQLALVLISSPNCCRFITDDLERSLLHCSACFGNVEVTKELMLYVPYTILNHDLKGFTPAHYAVFFSRIAVVNFLCTVRTFVDQPHPCTIKEGWNLFHCAAQQPKGCLMEILLRRLRSAWVGDQCCAQDLQGRTPLYFAVKIKHVEMVTSLLDDPRTQLGWNLAESENGMTPVHLAVEQHDLPTLRVLLRRLDVNAQDHEGRTALHRAVHLGHIDTLSLLLQRADIVIHAVDKNGSTPLHEAVVRNKVEVVGVLLGQLVHVHPVDGRGRKPLILAIQGELVEIIRLFLANPWTKIPAEAWDEVMQAVTCCKNVEIRQMFGCQ